MELTPLRRDRYRDWDEFCALSPDAWFWHTTDWLDYNLAYRLELRPTSYSFLVHEGSDVLAVVPLLLTRHEQDGRAWTAFSLSGNFLPSPALSPALSASERDDVSDRIFGAIDNLAVDLGVSHSRFRIEALRPSSREPRYAPHNALLRQGLIDCSLNTRIIDLRLGRNELRSGMRRNHLRSIETAREMFSIRIHSGKALSDDKFEDYIAMHGRAAGRATRARTTFEMMRRWLQSGAGFMAEAVTREGRTAGFELYIVYKKAAYGLSACNEPEYKHLPIRHLIEWEAMMWMREKGVQFYEIGEQHFGTLPYDFPEKKNMDISHFKYGFGGVTVPSFYAERFYSEDFWREEQKRRNDRFAARYAWKPPQDDAARALLDKLRSSPADPSPGSGSTSPMEEPAIPPSAFELVDAVLRENADGVKNFQSGKSNALHFIVGQALKRAGKSYPPSVIRRAVEARLRREGR